MNAPKRQFVVVDLENLGGCPPRTGCPRMYGRAFRTALRTAGVTSMSLVVIGVNPRLAFIAHQIAPSARLVVGHGPDGADLRLVAELSDADLLSRRFSEIVVGSGDWRFAEPLARLGGVGLATTVVARPGSLSNRLRMAAQRHRWLGQEQDRRHPEPPNALIV